MSPAVLNTQNPFPDQKSKQKINFKEINLSFSSHDGEKQKMRRKNILWHHDSL